METKLNFINYSSDANTTNVVLFHRNEAISMDAMQFAWKVIRYCGYANTHPFVFSSEVAFTVSDSFGNHSLPTLARPGRMYRVCDGPSGMTLKSERMAQNKREIRIANDFRRGAISVNIFCANRLMAQKTSIAPGQVALFLFQPKIHIGTASKVEEGKGITAGILSGRPTELSLLGIASADIVMIGGGPGPNSTPFEFYLENVQMA